ncbi:MAG: efflux RND transporter periplasmic adaptor subunit [Acidobacteriota bacterium]
MTRSAFVVSRSTAFALVAAAIVAALMFWPSAATDDGSLVTVQRGDVVAELTVTGLLRPAEALVYRSPLGGREAEIMFLAPEGTHVNEGDLLVQLDTADLQRERARLMQELLQAQMELQVAEIDFRMARGSVDDLEAGEGALSVEEAQSRLDRARRKRDRLRQEVTELEPLMAKGFLTRDEFDRTAEALDQAEEELTLASRRAEVLTTKTRPRELEQANLQLAQKQAQRENVRARITDIQGRGALIDQQVEASSLFAKRPGLVVHEAFVAASTPRKVRLGDRVTASQGIVTIPEVARMVVETSASERDMHRLALGQGATIRLEAYPALTFTGRVARVGTLARQVSSGSSEEKRFDVVVDVDPVDGADLRPEMTARVDVRLAAKRQVVVVPVNAVFVRDGASVCHVVASGGIEARSVTVGESSAQFVEVIAGLVEGERVSLMDLPTRSGRATHPPVGPPLRKLADSLRGGSDLAPR